MCKKCLERLKYARYYYWESFVWNKLVAFCLGLIVCLFFCINFWKIVNGVILLIKLVK
jgi:uncharacterized membrane protein